MARGRSFRPAVLALAAVLGALGALALSAVPVRPAGAIDPGPVVAVATNAHGTWSVDGSGGVVGHDGAPHFGSATQLRLAQRIVGMAATPTGNGYWLVASDGGIFTYGDAAFRGSAGALPLVSPVVGMATTPSGRGYWLVASDGGIFTYGDAPFLGSMGGIRLDEPVVGMAATASGQGYWLVAADGGMFGFGDARFHGSTGGMPLVSPVVGMTPTPSGQGYWLVAADGGVFTFGRAAWAGSLGGVDITVPVAGIAATGEDGYVLVDTAGRTTAFGPTPDPADRADGRQLAGHGVVDAGTVAEGVAVRTYRSTEQVVTTVDVAADAPFELDVVTAPGGVLAPGEGRGERTTSMCRRTACIAAVNGDFYDLDDREPYGGLIVGGELWRTTRPFHSQLQVLDTGRLRAADAAWPVQVVGPDGLSRPVDALNRRPQADQIAAFTPRAGTSSPAVVPPPPPPPPAPDDPAVPPPPPPPPEPVVRLVARFDDAGPLQLGSSRPLTAVELLDGGAPTPIGPETVVFVGRGVGASRLVDLWNRVDAFHDTALRLDIGGDTTIAGSIGGAPILGQRPLGGVSAAAEGRHPRTAIGQRADGSAVLVVVDGRRSDRRGVTIPEMTAIMGELGAEESINLDGGGSATLVAGGTIRNAPSDGSERRVSNALVLRAR